MMSFGRSHRHPSTALMSPQARRSLAFIARFAVIGLALAFVVNTLSPALVDRLRNVSPLQRTAANGTPAPPSTPIAVSGVDPGGATSPGLQTGSNQAQSSAMPGMHGPVSYADAVNRAAPAVVNIYANKITTVRQFRIVPDPLTQRLFGAIAAGPAYKKREQSLGSGVVFSKDGYVLTNNHVINGADDIQVLLFDGRVAQARVIGSDQETDLAVLKIDANELPTIALTDRGTVNVGDVVLAIGNPFGIGKTVTMGIVSGTNRQLRLSVYEDFIQTDAAINSGNSGGALVNALGELVGINTAVYRNASTDGRPGTAQTAEGIGFAIPVATAKAVLDQIIQHGVVIRGSLGIEYADTSLLAPAMNSAQPGALVVAVEAGGAASAAGVQPGDILLKLDGETISDQSDLRSHEAAITPGTRVRLEGMRDGSAFAVDVTVAQRRQRATAGT